MNETELKSLANHLGHDVGVHTSHYQLQTNYIEITKIVAILLDKDKNKDSNLSSDEEGEYNHKNC